jgi:DNA-binding FadR family transcriptional regulator
MQKRSFRRGRLSEQLVTELESMILEEYPRAGLSLPKEDELAERFGVSRIVVRESMKILEERGLVEVRAGRGTRTVAKVPEKVKEALERLFKDQPVPTLEDMESMLEFRQILEEASAELAAVRATPEDLREMELALERMSDGGAEPGIIDADFLFHRAVAKASHNRYLEFVLDPLMHVFLEQIKLTNSYSVGSDLHRHIFEAIRKANPVAARQAVRRLLRDTSNHVKVAIRSLPAPAGSILGA